MQYNVFDEAKNCSNCLQWHNRCLSECCCSFQITPNKKVNESELQKGVLFTFLKNCTSDLKLYYELHGCKYVHGKISIILNDFEVRNNSIIIYGKCKGLTPDLKCKYHGTTKQPKICAYPNINNHDEHNVVLTDNCLYRYK